MKKFRVLENDSIVLNGRVLFRIESLKDFSGIRKGDLGGYIQSDKNLSHEGNCWVYDNAKVYDNARVRDDASVSKEAEVYGKAIILNNVKVTDRAKVFQSSELYDGVIIRDDAKVYGSAKLYGIVRLYNESQVYGNARINGTVELYDYTVVRGYVRMDGEYVLNGYALIEGDSDYISISPIGSELGGMLQAYKDINGNIICKRGCYVADIHDFENKVDKTHRGTLFHVQYKMALSLIKVRLGNEKYALIAEEN